MAQRGGSGGGGSGSGGGGFEEKETCRDIEDYMEKSIRYYAAKCLSLGGLTFATPAALSTTQDLLIKYIKEVGTRARNFREMEEEERALGKADEHKADDLECVVYSMKNLMIPKSWAASGDKVLPMISEWRQDHSRFEYNANHYISRIIVSSHEPEEGYRPMSDHAEAQAKAIKDAEAQVEMTGRRFKHKFPHTPQFPPPITYGTTPGSIKRAETATLMVERPKKKQKTKKSAQKKSEASAGSAGKDSGNAAVAKKEKGNENESAAEGQQQLQQQSQQQVATDVPVGTSMVMSAGSDGENGNNNGNGDLGATSTGNEGSSVMSTSEQVGGTGMVVENDNNGGAVNEK